MKKIKNIGILVIGLLMLGFVPNPAKKAPKIDKEEMIARHNFYRNEVNVPDLKWSDELAEHAQKWADHLSTKCKLVHSGSKYGENIYYNSATASATDAIDHWAYEKKYFKNIEFKRGKSEKSGHYSQIIWSKTTHVGGAMQKCEHGGEIWVCNYYPHGNVIGHKTY